MTGIFGYDNVINGSAVFGPNAARQVENYVWFLKMELSDWVPGRPRSWREDLERDYERGQRLLEILHRRQERRQESA